MCPGDPPGTATTLRGVRSATPQPLRLWSGSLTVSARPWPGQPGCAYLLIAGGHSPDTHLPGSDLVAGWWDALRSAGYDHVRTGAVGPDIAGQLSTMGFAVCQDLVLLSADLGHPEPTLDASPHPLTVVRRGPGFRGKVADLLAVDEIAFGPEWALDMDTFREAARATEKSRIWVSQSPNGATGGFLLAGQTGATGFIQRIAVAPVARRSGVAAGLLAAGHQWMRARGCATAVVNTETTNQPALAMYQRVGYARMPYGLQVLERSLKGVFPA